MDENKELALEEHEKVTGGIIDEDGDDVLYEFTDYFNYQACLGLIGKLIKYKSTFWLTGSGKARVSYVGTGDLNGLELDNGVSVFLGLSNARVWVLNEDK